MKREWACVELVNGVGQGQGWPSIPDGAGAQAWRGEPRLIPGTPVRAI